MKEVVVPHVFRGVQFLVDEGGHIACHFKSAEVNGVEPEFQMDKYMLSACPQGCSCKHVNDFIVEANKADKLPEAFTDKALCLHNRQPISSNSTAHFVAPLNIYQTEVCKSVCGFACMPTMKAVGDGAFMSFREAFFEFEGDSNSVA